MSDLNFLFPKAIAYRHGKHKQNVSFQMFYYDDKRRCAYCGISEKEYRELMDHKDHVKTLTKDHVDAYNKKTTKKVWACIRCNLIKNHTFNYEEMKEIGKKFVRPIWESTAKKRGVKLSKALYE